MDGWSGMGWRSWRDPDEVRARLASGADPHSGPDGRPPPLHHAAQYGSAEVVAELAAAVTDVDAVRDGRTALWVAVNAGEDDNARALAAAGADPWRPMMNGWSPGRLSLAGPTPGLFAPPPGLFAPSPGLEPPPGLESSGSAGLSPAEAAAVAEAHRLIAALGDLHDEGLSLSCVAGVDAAEAVRRLDAAVAGDVSVEEMWDRSLDDAALLTVGVTDVPGGCVVSQPWAYGASTPVVAGLLSAGTVCYAMYANPKSGNQGRIMRDGAVVDWDLHPGGGWAGADESAEEILRTFLYRHRAVAYCCAYAGVRPVDARAFTGPPDLWVRLPDRDYWVTRA